MAGSQRSLEGLKCCLLGVDHLKGGSMKDPYGLAKVVHFC